MWADIPQSYATPSVKVSCGFHNKERYKRMPCLASLFTHYDIKFNFKPVAGPYLKQLRESSVKQPWLLSCHACEPTMIVKLSCM